MKITAKEFDERFDNGEDIFDLMENPKVMRLKDGSPTSCGSCKQEVSSVYIILSEKPLTKEIMKSKGLNIDGDSKPVGMRAFRHKTDESFEPIIVRVRFTIK